jgi:hypothetical protein
MDLREEEYDKALETKGGDAGANEKEDDFAKVVFAVGLKGVFFVKNEAEDHGGGNGDGVGEDVVHAESENEQVEDEEVQGGIGETDDGEANFVGVVLAKIFEQFFHREILIW